MPSFRVEYLIKVGQLFVQHSYFINQFSNTLALTTNQGEAQRFVDEHALAKVVAGLQLAEIPHKVFKFDGALNNHEVTPALLEQAIRALPAHKET